MGFWRAKHGLSKHGFKDQKIGLQRLKKEQTVKEEGEKRKKKRRRGRRRIQAKIKLRYGNYLEYGFCMDHMNFKALYG